MRDTSRHIIHRRPASSAGRTPVSAAASAMLSAHAPASTARVEALRKLVAAGQYHVSAKWLAHRICRCAGIPVVE